MLGINGKPFISLDHLNKISEKEWDDINFELSMGMAKSENTYPHSYYPDDHVYWPFHTDGVKIRPSEDDYKTLSREQFGRMKILGQKELLKFFKFHFGAYYSENQTLFLTKMGGLKDAYETRFEPSEYTDEAKTHFKKTIKMIEDLNIFDSIGRVIIFGSDPYQPVMTHRDQLGVSVDYFIHINPRKDKLFWVLDEKTGTKHYSNNHRVIIFNNADWHGADPINKFALTLKVSGTIKPKVVKGLDYGY